MTTQLPWFDDTRTGPIFDAAVSFDDIPEEELQAIIDELRPMVLLGMEVITNKAIDPKRIFIASRTDVAVINLEEKDDIRSD